MKRKIVEINEELCDGCGQCVPSCAEGAIEVVDGKAKLTAEKYCDGLGACLGECPKGALCVVERESDEFDEEAVERHLQSRAGKGEPEEAVSHSMCPGARIQSFIPDSRAQEAKGTSVSTSAGSCLSHWPVQIRLVPSTAPFLKDADLLVVADCVPVAYPDFHEDFMKGKAVMVGCPKFDDVEGYVEKFKEIFKKASIKSVTVLDMEVPCCSALPMIVKKGMDGAGKQIPLERIVISTRGEILRRERLAA
jgi:Fe-S-cluster-containing hydrogenase component 2